MLERSHKYVLVIYFFVFEKFHLRQTDYTRAKYGYFAPFCSPWGEHPDSRRKWVRQMIEHSNSYVAGWPNLKPSHPHLAEFMNPLLWQMTEEYFLTHVLVHELLSIQKTGRCSWVALKQKNVHLKLSKTIFSSVYFITLYNMHANFNLLMEGMIWKSPRQGHCCCCFL